MKLFTKYNRVNIAATILTFIIGSIAFYFVLQYVLIRQLDQGLQAEQQEIVDYLKLYHTLPDIQNTKHQWIQIETASRSIRSTKPESVQVFNTTEDEMQSIRKLIFQASAGEKLYTITVNHSETETEDLLQLIILVTIGMIGLILLLNYLINRNLINRLWQPFYHTIESIKDYHLAIQNPLELTKEPIDEINLLNDSLNKMTQRIHHDYHILRSFTENASHEMQTPLTIIRSKVESLLQDAEGNENMIHGLLAIEDSTQKLSRLHQSLLLLTKLENKQFFSNEPVNLTDILQTKLHERQELIASKHLILNVHYEVVILAFHQHLAEILITNLLNNVIRHTEAGGEISINLSNEKLFISNTASNGPLNETKIFQRFYKEAQSTEGTGLGLAIVKEISTLAGFRAIYQYNSKNHIFTIHFTS